MNRHDDHIRAFCLTYDRPIAWDKFVTWIEMLITMRGADLLRIKGILNIAGSDAPIAIHGIQHLFHPPAMLPGWQRRRIAGPASSSSRATWSARGWSNRWPSSWPSFVALNSKPFANPIFFRVLHLTWGRLPLTGRSGSGAASAP